MPGNYKVNLGVVLKHLDTNNMEVYEAFRQKEAERKELDRMLGYVLPIWMSGVRTPREQYEMTFRFNESVNVGWNESSKHPELRAKLLAAIGLGRKIDHDFRSRTPITAQANLTELLQLRYRDIRRDEVALWCSRNSEAVLVNFCDQYGIQAKDRDAILIEYRRIIA